MIASTVHHGGLRPRPGFLLLEVMLGIGIFGLFIAAVGVTLLYGQQNTAAGGDRVRGGYAVTEALEAARAVRDGSFASLTAGVHGFAINSSKKWALSGSRVTVSGGYVTTLTVASLASDWVRVTANTKWKHGIGRSGALTITGELTDWRAARATGDWGSATVQGTYAPGGNPLFNGVAVSGNYAYVTSETSGGGAGLYILDISTPSSPARVSSSFSLGAAGYGVAVRGSRLYVITDDPSQEIRVYDVSSPTTLSSANLVLSYNIASSTLPTSLAVHGDLLFVGGGFHASQPEAYAFGIGTGGTLSLLSTLDNAGSVAGVAVTGTGLYLASSDTAGEMAELAYSSTGALAAVAVPSYNITGGIGKSVAVSGTSAVLGLLRGSATQEMVLIQIPAGGGSPPLSPGPWYHEASGSVVAVGVDATACQAFLAADTSGKAVQIVKLIDHSLPELYSYDSTTGPARGLAYDLYRDRLFVATRTAVLIFQPGAGTGACP